MNARMMRIENGMPAVASASTSPPIVFSRPSELYAVYSALAITIPGIICAMSTTNSRVLLPRMGNCARA